MLTFELIQEIKNKLMFLQENKNKLMFLQNPFTKEMFYERNYGFYILPCVSSPFIQEFEKKHNILLPEDYRCFLSNISNGGPFCLYSLEDYMAVQLEKIFQYQEKWEPPIPNLDNSPSSVDFAKMYLSNDHISGSLRIGSYGVADTKILLIINGKERGNIWFDDRPRRKGIYPLMSRTGAERITFINFIIEWIEEELSTSPIKYNMS